MATKYIDTDYLKLRVDESIIKELLDITDITDDKVTTAISDAELTVDDYISKFYELPLSVVPVVIKGIVLDLAVHNIYQYRYDNKLPEHIEKKYYSAINYLKSIENGEHKIEGLDVKSVNKFKIISNKTSDDKIFNSTKLSQIS